MDAATLSLGKILNFKIPWKHFQRSMNRYKEYSKGTTDTTLQCNAK